MESMKNKHDENGNLRAAIKSARDNFTAEIGNAHDKMKYNKKILINMN